MYVKNNYNLVAHLERDEDGAIISTHWLLDHLISVGQYAAKLGEDIGCYYTGFLLGVLHDVGKAKQGFQRRILGLNNNNVNHSSAGAIFLMTRIEKLKPKIADLKLITSYHYREILFYIITAHHGLYDAIGVGQNIPGNFISRIDDRLANKEDEKSIPEEIEPFIQVELEPAIKKHLGVSLDELILNSLSELKSIGLKVNSLVDNSKTRRVNARERRVYEGFLTRLLLSILKTADCFDSSQWSQENKITPLDKNELGDIYSGYEELTEARAMMFAQNVHASPLNKVRTNLSNLAKEHSEIQACGVSQFEMPTGAGKTEAGLRYGVSNINKFGKRRLIYTAPFLSVVEQSAESIKKVVGEEFVLEHHSNVVADDDETSSDETYLDKVLYLPKSYIKDYWDAAVIVTTMVQLYNTLFSGKAASICRFCKLIDSTIILDEVQSLPVEHIYCFNLMLNFLSGIMNANILLCSATQPPFDHETLDYPIKFSDNKQVIPPNNELGKRAIDFDVFERSKVYPYWTKGDDASMTIPDVITLIDEQMEWADSVLCILNTKPAVELLFKEASSRWPEYKIVYLTTNLCAAHRMDIIEEIKKILEGYRGKSESKPGKVICISTSLIEAGVDVDFDVVMRSATGADSIEQARGRCNREGLLKEGGKVFVLNLKEDNTNKKGLRDIYNRGVITTAFINQQVSDNNRNLDMKLLTHNFYQKYFLENESDMKLLLDNRGTSALELLSTNDSKVKALGSERTQSCFKRQHLLLQSFRTASLEMKLIDDNTKSIIVPYKNEELLKSLMEAIDAYDFETVKKTLRLLQRYTVNVPKWTEPDSQCTFVYERPGLSNMGIYILQADYYDEVSGIQLKEASQEALLY